MPRFDLDQVDVFGSGGLSGNPVAVVHADDPGSGVPDDATMQAFAAWTNLSETTFLLPPTAPEADYRVRIFTTQRELPFAGHPTLGTAHAWLRAGGVPARPGLVVQECAAGLVTVRLDDDDDDDDTLAFAAPPLIRYEPLDDRLRERVLTGLGLTSDDVLATSWLVNGPEWIGVRLASAGAVLAVTPGADIAGLDVGIVGPHPPGGAADVEVRALFTNAAGVVEDPVTGSLNAGLAQWLNDSGVVGEHYVAAQGTVLGRRGRVRLTHDGTTWWIGGRVATIVDGSVEL